MNTESSKDNHERGNSFNNELHSADVNSKHSKDNTDNTDNKSSKPLDKSQPLKKARVPRCAQCRKKVPLISFTCKCQKIFCVAHQSPHVHACVYNYQAEIREKIKQTNPKVCPSTLINPI